MQACALTDIGLRRPVNQDYIFESVNPVGAFPNLFILADGMGGHKAGDFASKYLVETMVGYISCTKDVQIVKALSNALKLSNMMIYHKSQEVPELSGMGSTMVAAVIEEDRLTVANVGDSRLYLIRDGITQVTHDHSYVEELVEKGELERGSADYLMKKNIITRAVGSEMDVEADYFEVDLLPGDQILLCSDGLTNMVDDDTIFSIISGGGSLNYKARTLVMTANENGGNDNIAVILVKFTEGGEEHA